MVKRLIAVFLALVLCGSTVALAATSPVSPVTDATYVQIAVDSYGVGSLAWFSDKGWIPVDATSYIGEDNRLMVPFRWAVEVFGGSATWESRIDGTTSLVTLYAPPIQTITVTVPEYITQTVTVVQTVEVPALLPTLKLIKNSTYLTITPTATVSFWGLVPVGNAVVMIQVLPPRYQGQAILEPQVLYVQTDYNGYFTGSFTIPIDSRIGEWVVTAYQGAWMSNSEGFAVLGP
jgi:hypothetical protein